MQLFIFVEVGMHAIESILTVDIIPQPYWRFLYDLGKQWLLRSLNLIPFDTKCRWCKDRSHVEISVVTKYVNDISRLNQSGICFNWYFGRHIDIDTAKMYLLFYKKGKLS